MLGRGVLTIASWLVNQTDSRMEKRYKSAYTLATVPRPVKQQTTFKTALLRC